MTKYKNIFFLICVGGFIAYDLLEDIFEQEEVFGIHFIIESIVLIMIFLLVISAFNTINRLRQSLSIEKIRADKLSGELSEHIINQFNKWALSPTEQDIAMLLIKGLSFNEIASIRNVKNKTVRQQGTNIYSKAGIGNRSEFAAWFIEDLLQPTKQDS